MPASIFTTKIEIIQRAWSLLGQTIYPDTYGNFPAATELCYKFVYGRLIAANNWRFATKVQQLSQDVETPLQITGYKYQYTLPADYISLWRTYPFDNSFQIYANKLMYSNITPLSIEYRFLPPESQLPIHFTDHFAYQLAAELALVVVRSQGLADAVLLRANAIQGIALGADAQSHPNSPIVSSPYLDIRTGGYASRPNAGNWGS